jgi:hemerythrin
MEECPYIEYNQHKDEHPIFIDKIFHLIEDVYGDKQDTSKELLNFLVT